MCVACTVTFHMQTRAYITLSLHEHMQSGMSLTYDMHTNMTRHVHAHIYINECTCANTCIQTTIQLQVLFLESFLMSPPHPRLTCTHGVHRTDNTGQTGQTIQDRQPDIILQALHAVVSISKKVLIPPEKWRRNEASHLWTRLWCSCSAF